MNQYTNYIGQEYTEELKLIIYLTQDELPAKHFEGLKNIDWHVFLKLVLKHRVVSHILKHSTFLAEHLPIPIYEKLIDIRLKRSKQSLNFAIHAIRIYQQFEGNNIKHCFFKGPLLSLELYKDVGFRNFRDIDIIVNKEDVEKAKDIIEELGFKCIYPSISLSRKKRKINYTISHHYHFIHPVQKIEIELHWNMTNPWSYLGIKTKEIIDNSVNLKVSNFELPYISTLNNIVFQAAHGSIHQWYRLFWLKDFSVLISKYNKDDVETAFHLSKKLKLENSFVQACKLSTVFYNNADLEFLETRLMPSLIKTPLNSINSTDLSQKGITGKLRFLSYRIRLKKDIKYYFDLIYRLRTHLTDWEIININDSFFFLYYIFRPFLLLYKFLRK